MYTPLELVLGFDNCRRVARSALPDAPVLPPAGSTSPRRFRVRALAAGTLRGAAELIEPAPVDRAADGSRGEPARP